MQEEDLKDFETYKEIFYDFMLVFKRHESKMHSERVKQALQRAKQSGVII